MSDAGVASLVTGLITIVGMVVGFLTLWVKLKYGNDKADRAAEKVEIVEAKIDDNTRITRDGTRAAAASADMAARTATVTKAVVDETARKLNGGIDSLIASAVAPLQDALKEHSVKDLQDFNEIKLKFEELNNRMSQRDHSIAEALHVHGVKIEVILKRMEGNK